MVKKKNRRAYRKNKVSSIENRIIIMGANSAGLSSKAASFNDVLKKLKPSIFFIEETKMKQQGNIKIENPSNFIIFELNRKQRNGGGIAIGVKEELKPVWISEGNDTTEILVVEAGLSNIRVRCVGAYGPQENDILDKKKAFCKRLPSEVKDATENDVGFLLQMDGNLWAGPEVVEGDPNQCNQNGKLFKEFLEENDHLHVVNSLKVCQGRITRQRITRKKEEKSILDFFVVCSRVLPFILKMVVDEEKQYVLSNYNVSGGKVHKKDSDHNTIYLELNVNLPRITKPRIQFYNFKNKEEGR